MLQGFVFTPPWAPRISPRVLTRVDSRASPLLAAKACASPCRDMTRSGRSADQGRNSGAAGSPAWCSRPCSGPGPHAGRTWCRIWCRPTSARRSGPADDQDIARPCRTVAWNARGRGSSWLWRMSPIEVVMEMAGKTWLLRATWLILCRAEHEGNDEWTGHGQA